MSFLGSLSALGSGAMGGIDTGMDLRQKYDQMQGQQLLMGALQGVNGMSPVIPQGMGPQAPQAPQGSFVPPPQQPPPMPPQAPPAPPMAAGGPPQGGPPVAPQQPMQGGAAVMPASLQPGRAMPPPQAMQPQQAPPPPRPQPQQARPQPTPEQQQLVQQSQATPHELEQMRTKGIGWMTPQELATRIELTNPGASPGAKFQAMKAGMQLLNQSGQMQMLQMMQSREFHQDTMRHQEEQERHARVMEGIAATRAGEAGPAGQVRRAETASLKTALTKAETSYNAIESQTQNMLKVVGKLGEVAKKVSVSGNPTIDTWINDIRQKLGDPDAYMYKQQLDIARADIGHLLNNPTGNAALTEGARRAGYEILAGVMSPNVISHLKELLTVDAKFKKETQQQQIKELRYRMEHGGEFPQEQPDVAAAPTAGAPAGNDPLGIR